MIDFEKLDAMVNEVNNLIDDVDNERQEIKAKINNNYRNAFAKMFEDFKKYDDIIARSMGYDKEHRITYAHKIPLGNIGIKFVRQYGSNHYNSLYIYNDKNTYDTDITIFKNRTGYMAYDSLNKSDENTKALLEIALEWDNVKPQFETLVANCVNANIDKRSKTAHANYNKIVNEAERYKIEF